MDLNGADEAGFGNAATFTEDGPAIAIAQSDATLTDVDSANLTSMTVTLTNRPDGSAESLALTAAAQVAATAAGLTVASYNSGTGVLLITGTASKATYETVLRGIVYGNTDQDPSAADRSITVVVSDGTLSSAAATSTIHMVAVNDAAVLSADTKNLIETNAAADISTSGTLTISDVDSPATFVAQAGTVGLYGTFAIDAAGAWTYTASSAHESSWADCQYDPWLAPPPRVLRLVIVTRCLSGKLMAPRCLSCVRARLTVSTERAR